MRCTRTAFCDLAIFLKLFCILQLLSAVFCLAVWGQTEVSQRQISLLSCCDCTSKVVSYPYIKISDCRFTDKDFKIGNKFLLNLVKQCLSHNSKMRTQDDKMFWIFSFIFVTMRTKHCAYYHRSVLLRRSCQL